jgi:hypothetical protein
VIKVYKSEQSVYLFILAYWNGNCLRVGTEVFEGQVHLNMMKLGEHLILTVFPLKIIRLFFITVWGI